MSSSPPVRRLLTAPTPWVWPSSPSAARTRLCGPRQGCAGRGERPPRRARGAPPCWQSSRRARLRGLTWDDIQLASTIFAVKPGDGSAREQAASCQRVLGAGATSSVEYATKRYRSNLINWGMLPLPAGRAAPFGLGDYILIPIRESCSRAICRTSRPMCWGKK